MKTHLSCYKHVQAAMTTSASEFSDAGEWLLSLSEGSPPRSYVSLKHLSTFLQKFAVCLKLQFVYTSLFFEQISSTQKLHTEIAHRNCTLHVGRHKIFTAPCQVTADFLPCWLVQKTTRLPSTAKEN